MTYIPGDILLVDDYSGHGDFIGNLIFAGEKARYGVGDWTHCALIVDATGGLVESLQEGVRHTDIEKYTAHRTKIISPASVPADDPRRAFAVRYALGQVGDPYGVTGFIALALLIATGVNGLPHLERQPICSELVARSTESYTVEGYQYSSERMMPQDLDVYYGAPHGKSLSYVKRWLLLAQAIYWAVAPFHHGIKGNGETPTSRETGGRTTP